MAWLLSHLCSLEGNRATRGSERAWAHIAANFKKRSVWSLYSSTPKAYLMQSASNVMTESKQTMIITETKPQTVEQHAKGRGTIESMDP